ncbi:putative membrane protein [Synechococcus sp. PCC 7502]|uniref:GlsB/YeaQ/YmgE family stress response membrane protein n=1 Tax=Synechococcus sp. PCC 7502 TaxID=1173263 RepID=UPI00029F8165|nr:GlsB/YeaQ/YmgE family stress response membrane protein [Synechococcus sp. PCC 7502]AFY74514.1 putative membrane protein [Synechococcus sp. PCC 7502]
MSFIWFILIGLVAGALAGRVVQGSGFGIFGDIVVGIIGALLGGWLFSLFGIATGSGLIGSLIVATIGAIILLYGVRLVKGTS